VAARDPAAAAAPETAAEGAADARQP